MPALAEAATESFFHLGKMSDRFWVMQQWWRDQSCGFGLEGLKSSGINS